MLLIRSRQPTNCFGLGSRDENSATFALAWMLEQSPALRGGLLAHCGAACDSSRIAIECQRHEREEPVAYDDLVTVARSLAKVYVGLADIKAIQSGATVVDNVVGQVLSSIAVGPAADSGSDGSISASTEPAEWRTLP